MSSHLRVELRSPKRGLDGGYGFDLTKYCASCWKRLGRILNRGARCSVCGRRVCKGCRHFVAPKEWICSLCNRKRYIPDDSWHGDANIKRYKGSQGKSGTYLLRLTDWSAHGVLDVHTISEFQSGRIQSFYNESLHASPPFKNKLHRKNHISKSHYYPVKFSYNYPLIQHDIQLKKWKNLDDAMNPQSHKEAHLKYTSVNLKQKRREIREYRATSFGRGRNFDGTFNDGIKRKSYSNRISSTKREHFESVKTLFHDYDNPLTSSARRIKNNINSCANSSWQKESRRSRRSCSNFSHPPVLYRNEPHIRLSVKGTRIFGRRKSYRAYPTLKGDARLNGNGMKCKSTSLPCELSHVESHDYEFWKSGFVQSRVRKLEEELTAKCDDKYSYNPDYETQSLCSLQLDKILPYGDDYKIAYLSSTSQESSLDYMDDYCTIGMGTLDVKLGKKCVITGNEDWDLTFSSTEENDSSSDDDEFFYRKYTNESLFNSSCYSGNMCAPDDTMQTSKYGKKYSKFSGSGSLETPKSVKQQIHENVDRIFNDVMHCELDIQYPFEETPIGIKALEYPPHPLTDVKQSNALGIGETSQVDFIFSNNSKEDKKFSSSLVQQSSENYKFNSISYGSLIENQPDSFENQKFQGNVTSDDSLEYSFSDNLLEHNSENVKINSPIDSAADQFSECLFSGAQTKRENLIDNSETDEFTKNHSFIHDNTFNNLQRSSSCKRQTDLISKWLFSEKEPNGDMQQKILDNSTSKFMADALINRHAIDTFEKGILNFDLTNDQYTRYIYDELYESNDPENVPFGQKTETSKFLGFPVKSDNKSKFSNFDIESKSTNNSKDDTYSHKSKNLKFCTKTLPNTKISFENKRNKKCLEIEKKEKFDSNIKSDLEVKLLFYEPLSTPFSEIYFITYGKKYPTKSNYTPSIPRTVFSDTEVKLEMNSQNIEKFEEFSSHSFQQISVQNGNENSIGCEIFMSNMKNPRNISFLKSNGKHYGDTVRAISEISDFKKHPKIECNSKNILIFKPSHLSLINCIHLSLDIKNITICNLNSSHENPLSSLDKEKINQNNNVKDFAVAIFGYKEFDSIFQSLQGKKIDYNYKINPYATTVLSSLISLFQKCDEGCAQTDMFQEQFENSDETKKCALKISQPFFMSRTVMTKTEQLTEKNLQTMKKLIQLLSIFPAFMSEMKNAVESRNALIYGFMGYLNAKPTSKSHFFNCKENSYHETENSKNCNYDHRNYSTSLKPIEKNYDFIKRFNKVKRNILPRIVRKNTNGTNHKRAYKWVKGNREHVKANKIFTNIETGNFLNSLEQNSLRSKNCGRYQLTPRNRNYLNSKTSRKEIEITNEVPLVGETSESGFAAESQPLPATSSTGNATFAEYLFLPQLASVRDTPKTRLLWGSPIQLCFRSVPAVQRRLVDRESPFNQSGKDHKHGFLRAITIGKAVNIVGKDCLCGAKETHLSESFKKGYPLVLDCCESQRIIYLDHDCADYVCLGSVPTGLLQLICNQVTVGDVNCNNFNPASVVFAEFLQNMATCGEDPRIINKITRTPGRNISKLKKFFDSRENVSSKSEILCSNSEESSSSHQVETNNTTKVQQHTIESKSDNSIDVGYGNSEIDNFLNSSGTEMFENVTSKSEVRVSSDIPFCRKVSSGGDLWKNVDIGVKLSNEGLWTNAQNEENSDFGYTDLRQGPNSFVSSTADLHNLIAASRAELSKKKEPEISDKSTLENYFTSFENTKSKKYASLNLIDQSIFSSDSLDFQISDNETFKSSVSSYECDGEEMNFEEEEATLSDTSSDEEIRCDPPMNNHYLPAYSLHTIIEESCEESERDSRGATPTNEPTASKLERYFSWDIINDTETDPKRKHDDDSTVYSDSLSEASGSLNGDVSKEIDPSQLASSRLEKYFTSGLVGNENYFYPDDAEFLEDGPISDFEEDSIHQKISRSALLSSLETVSELKITKSNNFVESNEKELVPAQNSFENELPVCSEVSRPNSLSITAKNDCELIDSLVNNPENYNSQSSNSCDIKNEIKTEEVKIQNTDTCDLHASDSASNASSIVMDNLKELESNNVPSELVESDANADDALLPKQTVNKEKLAIDVQEIIKKLLLYFTDSGSNSFKHNMESDYISAWTILETEIERLIQSISSTTSLENNSCNSSTIDSNNSDYGSDTIESLDCMTDDDEVADSKNRTNAKYPLIDLLNAAYKIQPGHDFHNINISDETLSIWKRLIQSLQKDSFCISENKLYDPNIEARQYIRDQIVNLMHTVTVNENKVDEIDQNILDVQNKEIVSSLIEEHNIPDDINEAFNVSISNSAILSCLPDDFVIASKTEPSDDETSVESSENFKTFDISDNVVDQHQPSITAGVDFSPETDLNTSLPENSEVKDVLPNTHQFSEKLSVDEVDLKLGNSSIRKPKNADSNFSVIVDIELGDKIASVTEKDPESHVELAVPSIKEDDIKRSSLHMWVSGDDETNEKDTSDHVDVSYLPLPGENSSDTRVPGDAKSSNKSYRDTGYYSFKSSDDSLLNDTPPPDEFMDVPNFKSLKRSVKKFPLSNTLSKSTNNINQVLSSPDTKFSTLQLKSHKSKGSSSANSPSRQFTSLFSPSAVFRKLTGSKNNDAQASESSIPPKYLKKYARSSSVDSEIVLGAISMPHLNMPKPGDSYSALGLYPENDRDSSILDDDVDVKRYSGFSHSVLSLGAHSASMTSVYSAAGCHYGYVTVSGDVLFGLNYNQKSQMMEVFVKQCRNLAAVDSRRNRSDPYVKVYLLPDKTKSGKRKTKTKKNTLNPVFNELLRFPVLKHELESRTLWLSVWNSDLFGRNDFLGEITLPLGYRLLDSPTLRWYPLQERMESLTSPLNYKGEIFLALKYVPRDLSLESRFRPAPVISLRGALHVLVKEARNISTNGSGSHLDAFCKSYLLPDKSKSSKQKTPVVKRSRHPKWYYTVIYEDLSVDELKERSLELTLWDHDKITSNEFMGGVRLNLGSGLYHGVPVDWMDSRRDEAALWESMLQSPNMWVDGSLPLRPTMQFHHG